MDVVFCEELLQIFKRKKKKAAVFCLCLVVDGVISSSSPLLGRGGLDV